MRSMPRKKEFRERVLGPYPEPADAVSDEYVTRWRIIHVLPDGKRVRRSFSRREEADGCIAEILGGVRNIVHTTETAREDFLQHLKNLRRAPRTLEGYDWAMRTFFPQPRALHAVTPDFCERRYAELVRDFSVDSHRNALKMCRTVFKWCVKQHLLSANPFATVEGEGTRRKGKPQLRLDEARRFYDTALPKAQAGDEGALCALVCLLMGNRSSEVLNAARRDVDDGGRVLVVADAKTAAGKRDLDIPESLQPLLRQRAGTLGPGEFGPLPHHEDRLFPKRSRKWLWTAIRKLCEEAGVPRVSAHGLRGGFATTGRRAGLSAEAMALLLGHASTRVQDAHYVDRQEVEAEERRARFRVLEGGR